MGPSMSVCRIFPKVVDNLHDLDHGRKTLGLEAPKLKHSVNKNYFGPH
jgi:hypothetical protein